MVKHMQFDFKATTPKAVNKTDEDYAWVLPNEMTYPFITTLKRLKETGFNCYKKLTNSLAHYWDEKVLIKAKVPVKVNEG